MKCRKCGAELADGVSFCRECGTKVELIKKYCRECGAELGEGMKFCPNCGAKIEIIEDVSTDTMEKNEETLMPGENDKQSHNNVDSTDNTLHDNLKSEDDVGNIWDNLPKSIQGKRKLDEKQSIEDKIKNKLSNIWNRLDKLYKIIAVGMLITFVMFLIAVVTHRGLPIFISIMQILGLVFTIFLHKGIIKKQNNWLKYVVLIATVLLAVLNVMSYSFENKSEYNKTDNNILKKEIKVTTIQIPVGKEECVGKKYSEIEPVLSESGFTNISLEAIEDLKASESDKVGQIDNISVDGDSDFEKNQMYQSDAKIKINYHTYAKCTVNVHVNFVSNLMFSKYDVKFNFDGVNKGSLPHGESADYQLAVDPGEYSIEFISEDSSSVKGKTTLKVAGDVNVSYKIECHSDTISIEVEYTENLGDVGEDDIMMPSSMTDYKYNNYKDVEKELKELGFTNIKTKILYDIELGWTDEGETECVSINGKDDFNRGDIFSNSDEVIITYHMKAEDDPAKKEEKKSNKKTDTESKEEKDTESEAKENLTVDNCPELAAMLSNKAEIDPSYSDFAAKYKERTIEFDGRIDYCTHYENYDTRFDYLVSAGDYDPDHQIGPSFKFENVSYYDLHTDMDTVSVGWNVHIIAKVESFDANSGLFYLDPVSVTKR